MDRKLTGLRLDWSRLLGFDQVRQDESSDRLQLKDVRLAKIGVKGCQVSRQPEQS